MSHVVSSLQSALLAVIYLTGAIGGSRAVDALPIGSTPRDRDKASCAVEHHGFGLAAPHAPDDIGRYRASRSVIASEAKQFIAVIWYSMDCFVAHAPRNDDVYNLRFERERLS
jgi:hypothetical protein